MLARFLPREGDCFGLFSRHAELMVNCSRELAALIGAIAWNIITWWFGIPSSSSHALIGGLAGAALAKGGTGRWSRAASSRRLPPSWRRRCWGSSWARS